MSYVKVKYQMSNIKCQRSVRLNFCRSVPPELLRSFLIYTRLLNPQIYFRKTKLILPFFVYQTQNNPGYKVWSSASRFFENRCETLVDRSRPLCQVRNSAQNRKMRNQIIKVAAAGELTTKYHTYTKKETNRISVRGQIFSSALSFV